MVNANKLICMAVAAMVACWSWSASLAAERDLIDVVRGFDQSEQEFARLLTEAEASDRDGTLGSDEEARISFFLLAMEAAHTWLRHDDPLKSLRSLLQAQEIAKESKAASALASEVATVIRNFDPDTFRIGDGFGSIYQALNYENGEVSGAELIETQNGFEWTTIEFRPLSVIRALDFPECDADPSTLILVTADQGAFENRDVASLVENRRLRLAILTKPTRRRVDDRRRPASPPPDTSRRPTLRAEAGAVQRPAGRDPMSSAPYDDRPDRWDGRPYGHGPYDERRGEDIEGESAVAYEDRWRSDDRPPPDQPERKGGGFAESTFGGSIFGWGSSDDGSYVETIDQPPPHPCAVLTIARKDFAEHGQAMLATPAGQLVASARNLRDAVATARQLNQLLEISR